MLGDHSDLLALEILDLGLFPIDPGDFGLWGEPQALLVLGCGRDGEGFLLGVDGVKFADAGDLLPATGIDGAGQGKGSDDC